MVHETSESSDFAQKFVTSIQKENADRPPHLQAPCLIFSVSGDSSKFPVLEAFAEKNGVRHMYHSLTEHAVFDSVCNVLGGIEAVRFVLVFV